ncbi:hypothetical protein [Egbenema bharatensis]|uniref:hypothetical protein n=1 Tax=Egbenema bharatensis TaxID=3463334 RepID=UPI003A89D90B
MASLLWLPDQDLRSTETESLWGGHLARPVSQPVSQPVRKAARSQQVIEFTVLIS